MAIVITDGTYYICLNPAGKHRKTKDISEAIKYENAGKAISYMHIPQELRIRSRGTERCSASN